MYYSISLCFSRSSIFQVPLQTSNTNAEQDNQELDQLREKLAQVSSQVAQLGETNRAWQESHQSQLDNFRNKLKDCVEFDDDLPLDEMAERIADQITQEREAFVERYDFFEKANDGLHEGANFQLVPRDLLITPSFN